MNKILETIRSFPNDLKLKIIKVDDYIDNFAKLSNEDLAIGSFGNMMDAKSADILIEMRKKGNVKNDIIKDNSEFKDLKQKIIDTQSKSKEIF